MVARSESRHEGLSLCRNVVYLVFANEIDFYFDKGAPLTD